MVFDDYKTYEAKNILQMHRREASRQTCELITLAFLKSASDNMGLGEARLNRLVGGARAVIDLVGSEQIDIDGLREWALQKKIQID